MKKLVALVLVGCLMIVAQTRPALAGPEVKETGNVQPELSHAEKALRENVLEVQVETGATWSVGYTGNANYMMAPQMLSVNWNLDNIGLDDFWGGIFRGNTMWKTTFIGSPVFNGYEHQMFGFATGPQYNFVQPGWNLVPFISARVGLVFLDTTGNPNDIGQDFNFTFMVTPGARYFISDHSSIGANFIYQHISNGGLSEPEVKNRALDLVGFQISYTHSF
jgi:hypothetical protein